MRRKLRGGSSENYNCGDDIYQFLHKRFNIPLSLRHSSTDRWYEQNIYMGEAIVQRVLNEDLMKLRGEGETPNTELYQGCYDGFYYNLEYPICWFRALCIMLFFDQTFRNNVILQSTKLKTHDGTETPILKLLKQFIYNTANYFGVRMVDKLLDYRWSHHSYKRALMWFGFMYRTDSFSIEDLWLYFIILLNTYNSSLFPNSTIDGGAGHICSVRFFENVMPAIAAKGVVKRVIRNRNLTINIGSSSEHPPYVVLNYNVPYIPNSDADLAMFVRVNNKVYSLSSLLMTTYITLKWLATFPWSSHQYTIYKCNRRYYCCERINAENYKGVDEVPLIKYLLTDGMYPDDYMKLFKYDLNRSIRVGMYTRSMILFSEKEMHLLDELSRAIKNRTWINTIAILMYFTQSVTITLYTKPPNVRASTVVPTDVKTNKISTYRFWNHLDTNNGALNIMFFAKKLWPELASRPLHIGSQPIVEIGDEHVHLISQSWHYLINKKRNDREDPIHMIINDLTNKDHQLKCISFTARNDVQTETLTDLLKGLNKYEGAQEGGKNSQHIKMKKTKKSYKVRTDKQGKDYIMSKKQKVYLSSIRGTYLRI